MRTACSLFYFPVNASLVRRPNIFVIRVRSMRIASTGILWQQPGIPEHRLCRAWDTKCGVGRSSFTCGWLTTLQLCRSFCWRSSDFTSSVRLYPFPASTKCKFMRRGSQAGKSRWLKGQRVCVVSAFLGCIPQGLCACLVKLPVMEVKKLC